MRDRLGEAHRASAYGYSENALRGRPKPHFCCTFELMNLKAHESWYASQRDVYARLGRTVEVLLRELLTSRGIDFLAIESRAKTVESFVGKLQRKSYKNPRIEVTDLCGVRVITYLETDVDQVAGILPEVFRIDRKRSVDKTKPVEVDRFGYRSKHFICDLGPRRRALPEYTAFDGLQFEVQVRTVLQHAWAQIEHDRNYKSGGVLPEEIRRDFYLVAGALERADRDFVRIANDIAIYTRDVEGRIARGDLRIPITSTSMARYLEHRRRDLARLHFASTENSQLIERAIQELSDFGVETLTDLDAILSPELIAEMAQYQSPELYNQVGLVREAMLFKDAARYFSDAWKNSWDGLDPDGLQLLIKRYGAAETDTLLKRYGITVMDDVQPGEWTDDDEPSF